MQYGDIVTIQIRIKNNGLGSGYAKEVTSTIADGMEYIEDNEINKANGWKLDGKKVTTSKYSYETDINNELYPKRYEYEENEDYSDIKNTITNEDKKEKSNDETLLEKDRIVPDSIKNIAKYAVENVENKRFFYVDFPGFPLLNGSGRQSFPRFPRSFQHFHGG